MNFEKEKKRIEKLLLNAKATVEKEDQQVEYDLEEDEEEVVDTQVPSTSQENGGGSFVNTQDFVEESDVSVEDLADTLEESFVENLFDDLTSSDSDSDCELGEDFIEEYFRGRVRHLVRNTLICTHGKIDDFKKCACLSVYRNRSTKKYYFDEMMLNDIRAILFELRMGAELKTVPYLLAKYPTPLDYIRHKGVRMICASLDKDLVCHEAKDRIEFLREVYEIREFYGIFGDKGQASELSKTTFEAQGLPDFIKKIWDFITETITKTAKSLVDVINTCFKKILDIFQSVFGFISDSISKVMSSMFSKMRHAIIKWIDPIKAMKDAAGNNNCFLITCVVTIAVCLIIDIVGILSYKMTTSLIDKLLNYCRMQVRADGQFEAQGPSMDPTAGIVAIVGLILGLTVSDLRSLSEKCRSFVSIISAGVGASWLAGSLFMSLPIVVQSALKMKYGSQEEKDKMVIDDWLERSLAVIRLKKIPQVLISEEYFVWVRDLVDSAMGLKSKIKSPVAVNMFTRNLVSIMEILNILENYRLGKSYRDYPFSVHIAAPPGYGKTLVTSSFVRDLFEVQESEIYDRPVSAEHWDGFIGQTVVIFDEFLVGDNDYKMRSAKEYLEIVSNKVFKPPCASVDNPMVGLKGTPCEPLGVVTINNNLYEKVDGIPNQALWRRREIIIELSIAPGYEKLFAKNKVDLSQLSVEQIRDKVWLKFSLHSPEPNKRAGLTNLSYAEMMTLVRGMRRKHLDVCDKIRVGRNSIVPLDKTPKQMLEDSLRELKGVPNEPIGLMDSILSVFGDFKFEGMFTQGNSAIKGDEEEKKEEEALLKWAKEVDEYDIQGYNDCTHIYKDQLIKLSMVASSKQCIMEPIPSTSGTQKPKVEDLGSDDDYSDTETSYANMVKKKVKKNTPESLGVDKLEIMDEKCLSPPSDKEGKRIYNRINKSFSSTMSLDKIKMRHSKLYQEVAEYIDARPRGEYIDEDDLPNAALQFDVIKLAAKFNFYTLKLRKKMLDQGFDLNWVPHGFDLKLLYGIECQLQVDPDSPDEKVKLKIQKDVVATIDHDNVDPTKLHRHTCHGMVGTLLYNNGLPTIDLGTGEQAIRYRVCGRNFAHKHDANVVHDKLLCKECEEAGASQVHYEYHPCMIQMNKPGVQYPRKPVSQMLPVEYDYDYVEIDVETRDKMNAKFMDIYLKKFTDFGQIPLVILEGIVDEEGEDVLLYCTMSPQQVWIGHVNSVAKWVGIFSLIYGIRKMFFSTEKSNVSSDEERIGDTLCFSQSARPDRTTKVHSKIKTFAKAQSLETELPVQFFMRGLEYRGIPIKGKIFLTYYHAFFDGEKMLPEGTRMSIRYGPHKGEMNLTYSLMMIDPENDLAFVSITDNKFPSFPNNLKKFLSVSEMGELKSTSVYLPFTPSPLYAVATKVERRNYAHKDSGRMIKLAEALQYRCPTRVGDCGTMVKACGEVHPGKILGMHVAGGPAEKDFYGLAVIITKEDIISALSDGTKDSEVPILDFLTQGPIIQHEDYYGPNVRKVEAIPYGDQIFVNRVSKLKSSCISEEVPIGPFKNRPILSANDKRNFDKIDPLKAMMKECCSLKFSSEVDLDLVKMVYADMFQFYDTHLEYPFGKRNLTFEEALKGVPGKLCSMKVNTSAGFPLCKMSPKKGKTAWFGFDANGELHYEDEFRTMVEQFGEMVESRSYEDTDRRFLAFLKDELVTDKKIREGRNRVIFCGDLVANTYYRMKLGAVVAAFNSSFGNTPSAIGINQYSTDMHMVYNYLTEVGENFIAGDFKNLDKLMHPIFKKYAYELIHKLAGDLVSNAFWIYFMMQQLGSPVQIEDVLVWLMSMHFSGLFFTTIINNLVHEGYIRYTFARLCPNDKFDEHMRIKLLGDDHIYCVSDYVMSEMTPFNIREELARLGQVYTSDDKDKELENVFRSYDQITFLGAHPVMIEGQWCGAMKKNTLIEMLHWTRNNNVSLREEIETAMDLATVWDFKFFEDYVNMVKDAIKNSRDSSSLAGIKYPLYYETRRIVASRTAASGLDFPYNFTAQGPGLPDHSLANVKSGKLVSDDHTQTSMKVKFSKLALNEETLPLTFGTESTVYRDEFEWKTSDPPGTAIKSYDAPFGLLSYSTVNNLQNMPFDRFLYWKGDVKVVFQVNATPFQCGLLAVYFVPLASYEVELPNVTACQHILIQPDQSATYELNIPFMYLRSVMNTRSRDTESLGTIYVTPLSALSSPDVDSCTITMFTSFPNSEFTIPRPVESGGRIKKFYRPSGEIQLVSETGESCFMAQGNSNSTHVTQNITNIGGDMPIQDLSVEAGGSAEQSIDANLDATIPMPLDNPPLCSGAIPMQQSFSGMSSSHGIRPTVDMQLKPAALSRQHISIFDPSETKISSLCGKKCLLTTIRLDKTMLPGTKLYEIGLNTRFGLAVGQGIPINVSVLNQFIFWRGDIHFELVAAITKYHSTRIQMVTAYGSPDVDPTERNVVYSKIMNFSSSESGTNYSDAWTVAYNQQTEFLRTYEGESVSDKVQNYSLGSFAIFVQNALIAPDSVSPAVDLLLFIRLGNIKVAVPRPNSPFTWNGALDYRYGTVYTFANDEVNAPAIIEVSLNKTSLKSDALNWVTAIPPAGNYQSSNPTSTLRIYYTSGTTVYGETRQINKIVVDSDGTYVFHYDDLEHEPADPSSSPTNYFTDMTNPWSVSEIPVHFMAQGPVIQEEQLEQTTAEIDVVPTETSTLEQSNERPNIPCKLEIGAKFEFCVSDIHEIGRRYVRIVPGNNPDLEQYVKKSHTAGKINQTIFNIGTQPWSAWKNLFCVWAGGLKYRIFDTEIVETSFVPFYNRDPLLPGVPIVDCYQGTTFNYLDRTVNTGDFSSGPLARERSYPISNVSFIDVSTPFQSHFNMCYTNNTQEIAPISSGTLSIIKETDNEPILYNAMADDFRLGMFRPPETTSFNMDAFTQGIGGFYN